MKEFWSIKCYSNESWEETKKIIKEKFSKEDFDAFCRFENSKEGFGGNMAIMRKEIFDEYSQWLFKILFELEKNKKIKIIIEDKRLFGRLGEMLLNVFIEKKKKKYKIKEIPICSIKGEYTRRI
jgi:hypothetical protein